MSFGNWLKRRRQSLDLTQHELAAKVGCSVFAVRKFEGEERRPSRQLTHLLAEALAIPEDERALFIKVARGERESENLEKITPSQPGIGEIRMQNNRARIPVPPTPLVGRENEMEEIVRMLREPDCRLLTLIGGGGIGKTRLCLEVARRFAFSADRCTCFTDGIYFIPFAHLTASEHIPGAVAEGIGFSFSGAASDKSQLFSFLQDKHILLVLDNLEHLLHHSRADVSQFISDILCRAPEIKVLAASRESINIQEEWGFEVSGLPYPLPSTHPSLPTQREAVEELRRIEEFSAVKLFLQSVRRKDSRFQLAPENYQAVLRICHLVNGMPLGIELAAGWTTTLTCDEIAQEIADNLDFLSTTLHNVPERHRSIRAALDHSWNLLTQTEKSVLAKLAVFQGGFRRDAADYTAGAGLAVLSKLIDKSLIYRSLPGRYDMHDLVRQYALDQLEKQPEVYEQTYARHCSFFLDFLQSRFPTLRNQKQRQALIDLTLEADNLRLAWETAVRSRQVQELHRAAVPFMVYHELRNIFQEGETFFQHAVEMVEQLPPDPSLETALADLMAQHAWFGFRLGKMGQALYQLQEAIALLRKHRAYPSLAEVLWYHAFACWFSGSFPEGLQSAQEGIELNEKLGHQWQLGIIWLIRGGILHDMGAYDEADAQLARAVALCRQSGDPRTISVSISLFCRNRQAMNQHDGLKEILHEGLQLSIATEDRYGIGMALEQLGLAALAKGDSQEARERFLNCIQLFREIGDHWSLSRSYNSLGKYYLSTGELADAGRSFVQAHETALKARAMSYAVEALANLALVKLRYGDPISAFRYTTFALQHGSCSDGIREQAHKLFLEIKSQMSEEQHRQAASAPISMPALFEVANFRN
jgi:predicted ATPase/DNA-binding XRE family transcriptional regulator